MFSGYDEYESIIDFKKKEYYDDARKRVEELAVRTVCPNTGVATTVYEINMVKTLVGFGMLVLQEMKNDRS